MLDRPKLIGRAVRILYSFVIDADARFYPATRILLSTLRACGVPSDQIRAHTTPTANLDAVALAKTFGVVCDHIQVGPDRRFTNKIQQMFAPAVEEGNYDVLALCDTDLAFVERIERHASTSAIRARRVDGPNPPLRILDSLASEVGLPTRPGLINTTVVEEPTYDRNCNGGLMLIPRPLIEPVRVSWLDYATRLHAKIDMFEMWINNIDQVAWAFALSTLDLPFSELPIELNFPSCTAALVPVGYGRPIVLHHHHDFDDRQRIRTTGVALVDEAVERANASLGELAT